MTMTNIEENKDKIAFHVSEMITLLGGDLEDPNFKETPGRVAKAMIHFFRNDKDEMVKDLKAKVFPSTNDQMVIVRNIEAFGMCPHHLLPVEYDIAIGYIPNGKVLGLSKLARLAITLSSYPKLQEDITSEIAGEMVDILEVKDVMVVVNGIHGCMRFRGVEMDSSAVTSDCRGRFRQGEVKAEFLRLMGNGK